MDDSIFGMFSDVSSSSNDEEAPTTSSNLESVSFSDSGKTFVVSIGGSIIAGDKPKTSAIAKICSSISNLSKKGYKFVLVTGGGKVGRSYITSAKTLGAGNFEQDEIGIAVSRLNALLLIQGLDEAFPVVLDDVRSAAKVLAVGKIPVFGGLIPGFTTDGVSALIAESLNADFINLTDVDGIFDKDPSKFKTAKLQSRMTPVQLVNFISKHAANKPGQNLVLDLPSAQIIRRSNIKAFVLNGNDLNNFADAVEDRDFTGTLIQPSDDTEFEEL